MNKKLNSAIAHLDGKYGVKVVQIDKTLYPEGHQKPEWVFDFPTPHITRTKAEMKPVRHFADEKKLLALAKSAGWTGEEWEPKEGDRTSLLERENKMLREEVAELNRKLKEQDDGIQEMIR